MVRVLSTQEFDTWEHLLPKNHQKQVAGFIEQLKKSWNVGKPLVTPFFARKRWVDIGCTFWVYEDINTVLLITVSDKKAQQEVIDTIKREIQYKELVQRRL